MHGGFFFEALQNWMTVRIFRIDINPEKDTNDVGRGSQSGPVERRALALIQGSGAGLLGQEEPDHLHVTSSGRQVERRLAARVRLVHRAAGIQQQPHCKWSGYTFNIKSGSSTSLLGSSASWSLLFASSLPLISRISFKAISF